MSTETNFNAAPFWDDFDDSKSYHRILFRPGVPVQARELTQAQTILQNQIEKFGENIFRDGTIIKGCTFTHDSAYFYIKLLDNQTDGQPLNPSMFANTVLVNSANVHGLVVNFVDGLESQNPLLNTLYIKYLNTGVDGTRNFNPGEVVSAYNQDNRIEVVNVANTGTGYSNSDTLIFTSNTGTGASARIVTDTVGRVQDVVILAGGKNYTAGVTVAVANSSGGTANGSGAVVTATPLIAQMSIASNTFSAEAPANVEFRTVGSGYALNVSEGIIFQKGFFIQVAPQTVVVSRYNSIPDDLTVGFTTGESVVNNSVDVTLLDNAQGEPNFSAPGAFRLKMTPKLTVLSKDVAAASNTFLSLVSFDEGRVIQARTSSDYNIIGNELARRTSEESGNYVVNPFTMYTDDIASNTTHIQLRTSSGLAYVNGYRVEQLDTNSMGMRRGTDVRSVENVTISTNYSNHVLSFDLQGTIPFQTASQVSLRSLASTGRAAAAGVELGTAKVRAVVYDSGLPGDPAAVYRLYLFDIQLAAGSRFADVRSIFYTGGVATDNAAASLVLETGKAVLKEPSLAAAVFPLGRKAIKTIRDTDNNNDTNYIYTTTDTGVNFSTSGTLQKNLSGNDRFPYNGTLNDIEERDFIFIARNAANSSVSGAGTLSSPGGVSNTVTGVGTSFQAYYTVGDHAIFATSEVRRIVEIANNTSMTIDRPVVAATSAVAHCKHFPAYVPIPFTNRAARTITVSGGQQTLTAAMGHGLNPALNVSAVYNIQRSGALQLTKNFNKSVVVKIATGTTIKNQQWCLGVPDAVSLISVTRTHQPDYVTDAIDVTEHFQLLDGQMDTHYGLSAVQKKATSDLVMLDNQFYLIRFSCFTHTNTGGGIGFFTVDSYPVDDTANTYADSIKTYQIPVFASPTSGSSYDLRDSVDFRPVVANTANVATSIDTATVNPAATETFAVGEKFFPAPNKNFMADLQYYVGRYDKLLIASTGQFMIVEGTATESPYPPQDQDGAMTLATVAVPPYPTLSTKTGTYAKRPDYTIKVTTKQTRRYTMSDIGKIDNRIQRLEYYTALNLLEKQTTDLNIPSSVDGLDRFKNGIFVDPFTDFSVGNVIDGEFTAGIDEVAGELIPRFQQAKFDLGVGSVANTTVTGSLVTLPYTSTTLMSQPYANRVRNCVENFWSFKGKLTMVPSYDNFYEVRSAPQNNMSLTIDTASATLALVNELNNIRSINQPVTVATSTTNSGQGLVGTVTSSNGAGTTTTQTFESSQTTTTTQAHSILNGSTRESTEIVGDFVTDISFSPFMSEQAIHFRATGLKPGSHMFAYFDKVNVSSRIRPAIYNAARDPNGNNTGAWEPYGQVGQVMVVTATGEVAGIFYMPASTFFVGDRELKLLDVNALVSESSASTSAADTFHGYNFSASKSNLIVSTRAPIIDTSTSYTSTTTTTRSTEDRSTFVPAPPPPPEPEPQFPPIVFDPFEDKPVIAWPPTPAEPPAKPPLTPPVVMPPVIPDPPVDPVVPPLPPVDPVIEPADPVVPDPVPEPEVPPVLPPEIPPFVQPGGGGGGGWDDSWAPGGLDVWGRGGGGFNFPDQLQVDVVYLDPIAQTFRLTSEQCAGQEGIFLSKLDIYFQRKDATMGVTVELRLTENGYPSSVVLPLGRKHLTAAEITVSDNATAITTVTFDSPVFVKSGQEYCFVVIPDGNSPEYLIWTAVVGENDVTNPATAIRSDWGGGVMFTSTNNSAWVAYQDEDIKFRLYRADFSSATGTVTLTNGNEEFLTASNIRGPGFIHGEPVFKYAGGTLGHVSFNPTTQVVTGSNTSFLSQFSVGKSIVLSNTAIIASSALFDVFEIAAIANNTSMTIRGFPKFTGAGVRALSTITAKVGMFDYSTNKIQLTDSTANSSLAFAAGDIVVGGITGTRFAIGSVDNEVISYMQPLIYRTSVIGTGIAASVNVTDAGYTTRSQTGIKFNDTNYLTEYEGVVASRSNELAFMGGAKSFSIPVTMTSASSFVSPTIDLQACSILRYKNLINNSLVGEVTGNGSAVSKYVSKTIVLSDGQESEDIKVYTTAYKPVGTSIDVYVRVMASSDPEFLTDKTWTKLTQVGSEVFSDSADRNNFREFEYTFPVAPTTTSVTGTVSFTANSANITAIDSLFNTSVAVGDVLKINNGSAHRIAKVTAVTSNTALTLSSKLPWTGTGGSVEKLVNSEEAFRNPDNLNIVSYFNGTALFDGYKTYAIKVVLRAESTNRVPRLRDTRAVALSI